MLAYRVAAGDFRSAFLRDRIEAALRASLPAGSSLEVGSAAIGFSPARGLAVDAVDVSIALPGATRIAARRVSTLTDLADLLSGRIEVRSVRVEDLRVALPMPAAGGGAASTADSVRSAAEFVGRSVAAADERLRAAGLSEVVVAGGAVALQPTSGGAPRSLAVRDASWMPLGAHRSKAWMQIGGDTGERWSLTVEHSSGPAGRRLEIAVRDVPMAAAAAAWADAAFIAPPLDIVALLELDGSARFSRLRMHVAAGEGPVAWSSADRLDLAGATIALDLPADGTRVALRQAEIRTAAASLAAVGSIDLSAPGGAARLALQRVSGFLPSTTAAGRVRILGGTLVASFDPASLGVVVESLDVSMEGGRASLMGQVSLRGPAAGLSLALSLSEMPAMTARAFWPPMVAPHTRRWFDEHVRSGVVGPANLAVSLPLSHLGPAARDKILPDFGLVGAIPYRAAAYVPLDAFPPVEDAAGEVRFADATAYIRSDSGRLSVGGRGEIRTDGTTLVVPELGRRDPLGSLDLRLSGSAAALAALADTPPLDILKRRGLQAEGIAGSAELALQATIPLQNAVVTEIRPAFRLQLDDFASASPIEGRHVAAADLVLEGTVDAYTLKGAAVMDGVKASLDLAAGDGAKAGAGVTLTLDDAARRRLGLDLGPLLRGPVVAALSQEVDGRQSVRLDLTQATISLPFLAWEKGAGVAAKASFEMGKGSRQTAIRGIEIAGRNFGAKGELTLDAEGRLSKLALDGVRLRSGDDFSVTVERKGGSYAVAVRGTSLDVRGLIRSASPEGATAAKRLSVTVALDQVVGQDGTVLRDLGGRLTLEAGTIRSLSLAATASRSHKVTWEVAEQGGEHRTTLRTGEGGTLLRFLGIYGKISGGDLALDYRKPVGGSAGGGVLQLWNFRVTGEAALSDAIGPAAGSEQRRGGRQAGAMGFTKLKIPFRQSGGVVTVEEAYLRGPMLGATGSGTINMDGRKIAVSGTLVPAFGINNIAGAIPLLGGILGGGKNEGLLGITYKLYGPLDSPTLSMNPISAMAPGIFRKIFEYQ